MKKRSTLTIIGLALLTSLILVKPVFAASWILLARLPGLSSVEIGPGSNPLGVYIKAWYGFIIGSIGIITTLMIMWGGFKWLYSRGDSGEIGKAKEIIFSDWDRTSPIFFGKEYISSKKHFAAIITNLRCKNSNNQGFIPVCHGKNPDSY